ncbi:MAG: GIY-YIG nuclease family protein [Vulcanimicrobiaceae bacterium]
MAQTLISNMGLFWRSDNVFWGRPGPEGDGRILGVPAKNRSAASVDFREQEGIYVLYSEYRAVYVGQTAESQGLLKRLNQHLADDLAERWDRFSWFGLRRVNASSNRLGKTTAVRHVLNDKVLNHIEGILIHAVEPPLNRQHGRFGEDVIRFLQVRDERLGPSQEEMIKELLRVSAEAS